MTTTIYFRSTTSSTHRSSNSASLSGGTLGWFTNALSSTAGASLSTHSGSTVTGPTAGIEVGTAEWLSEPLAADTTISGSITANLWSEESNMSANVAINFVIDKVAAADGTITNIVTSARTTELAVGPTRAVNNFAATPGAGVTLNRGDRIRARVFGDDAGTMATGFTFSFGFNGNSAGADGDSFLTFTETFSFDTAAPSGTVVYLTDTASDVSTASVDREAWTSRGAGVQTDVTNTAAGWTAGIQVTDTAGGTVVDWFTRQLTATTLSGPAVMNVRAQESSLSANASLRVQIARVASDGTSPTIWGSWCIPATSGAGEITTSEASYSATISGDDLAISDGQRLRIRIYVDDLANGALVTGFTVTTYYAGTTGGASGDTFVTFSQTLTEFSGTAHSLLIPHRHRSLIIR